MNSHFALGNKLVVKDARLHMGRLLHALLLANGKASVLLTL